MVCGGTLAPPRHGQCGVEYILSWTSGFSLRRWRVRVEIPKVGGGGRVSLPRNEAMNAQGLGSKNATAVNPSNFSCISLVKASVLRHRGCL